MIRRILFAAIALSFVLLGFNVAALGWLMYLMAIILAVGCLYELAAMLEKKSVTIPRGILAIATVILVIDAARNELSYAVPILGVTLCLLWALRLRKPPQGAAADMAGSALGLLYVAIPFAVFAAIFAQGFPARAWLLYAFSIVWVTDSGALFVGKAIGKNKLCPSISPGKTIEGFFGGLVSAGIAYLFVRVFFNTHFAEVGDTHLILFTFAISLISQLGDLSESMLKRDIGTKDSGSELTGHGGFLDLMDAVVYTTVPLYAYLIIFQPGVIAGISTNP